MTSRILVVDNESVTCLMFKQVLERCLPFPCMVETVLNGPEALASARDVRPDLVLLDIRMPGMSGFEVCRALKADPRTAKTIVVFVSGNSAPCGSLKCAQAYLVKPVSRSLLCETVTRMLGKPGAD